MIEIASSLTVGCVIVAELQKKEGDNEYVADAI